MAIALLVIAALVAVLVVAILASGGAAGPRPTRREAELAASLEAERLLGERYSAGEITLEEFERDLAGVLARRGGAGRRG